MILVVQHWNFDDKRKNEILTATLQNLKNKFIDKIYIFLENRANKILPSHNKIHYIEDSVRLSYNDMFNFCKKNFDDTCIVANADIIFDDTLLKLTNLDIKNKIIALTSYDYYNKSLNSWSYDSFIFNPKTLPSLNINIDGNFTDLKFVNAILTKGISIINPSLYINSFHIDNTKQFSNTPKEELFYFILPHNINESPLLINNKRDINTVTNTVTEIKSEPIITTEPTNKKVALVIHLYYHDLWDEMVSYINTLSNHNYDLYITLVDDSTYETQHNWMIEEIQQMYPDAKVFNVPNKGMDIGSFLLVMNYIIQNKLEYDYICKIHTKKSIKSSQLTHGKTFGNHWRKKLIEPLVGSNMNTYKCIKMFENNSTGMITAKHNINTYIGKNTEHINHLKSILNIKDGNHFVAGTMFWVRFNILCNYFYNSDIIDTVYNMLEDGYILDKDNGSYTHAMERIFGYIVTDLKYNIDSI